MRDERAKGEGEGGADGAERGAGPAHAIYVLFPLPLQSTRTTKTLASASNFSSSPSSRVAGWGEASLLERGMAWGMG